MKKLFLIIFVLMTTVVFAQQTLPCTQIGVSNLAGQNPYITGSCLEVNSDLHVNNKNVIMEADNRIHFGPGTRVSLVQQGNFHASIRPNALQMAWIEPGTVGSVGQFKKLELGIKLNSEIESLIDEFISAGKSDVAPRTNPSLNPFDPDEIDVYAELYYQFNSGILAGPFRQNGFFFEDFMRNMSDPDPVNWTWDKVQSDYRFRVRFTPRATGIWKCRIIANIAGFGQFSTSFFSFNVTPSDGHDFVSVGPNKRFLKIGSEPFFPVGMNLADPMCYIDQNGTWDYPSDDLDPYNYGCIGFPDATYESGAGNSNGGTTSRLKVYTVFEQELEAFADAGANYFKMDILPWFSDIEFEQICNYYNRMNIGWEVDNIVEKAEQEGLFIHFNTAIQYYFLKPDRKLWDWSAYGEAGLPEECDNSSDHGYCYNSDLGLPDPKSFFSNENAKKYYQKRLRYMIARWGYSTNISAFETINEINGTCGTKDVYYDAIAQKCIDDPNSGYNPYSNEYSFRRDVYKWQSSMITAMDTYMGHDHHLLSVNYLTEGPNLIDDPTYFLPKLDIVTHQCYRDFPDIYNSTVDIVNDLHDNSNANSNDWFSCDKPFIHGEFGSGTNQDYYLCDNNASWIRDLWIGSFTGICGSALMWDNMHKRELWPHFGRLRAFVAGYDFDESNGNQKGWIPYHDFDEMHYENWQRKPGIVDLFYLRSPDKQRAIGVLANRTFNFYTQWDVAKCDTFEWSGDDTGGLPIPDDQERFELTWEDDDSWNDSAYNNQKTAYHINEAVGVDVKKMKNYSISYIDPYTLQVVGTQNKYNVSGKLNLDFPYLTGSQTRPILLVKIEPKKDKSPEECPDSVQKYLDQIAYEIQEKLSSMAENSNAQIYPNPADDFVMIELPKNITSCKIDLLSCSGTIIKSNEFPGSMFKFYFGEISTGIYILRLSYNQKVETYKLSVQ